MILLKLEVIYFSSFEIQEQIFSSNNSFFWITWNDLERIEATYNKQETTWSDLKQPRASKKRLAFYFFFKLFSNFFNMILFMGVVFNSSSESPWVSVSIVASRNVIKAGSVRLSAEPVVI